VRRGIIGVFLLVQEEPSLMAEMPAVFLAAVRLQSGARAGNRSLGLFFVSKAAFGAPFCLKQSAGRRSCAPSFLAVEVFQVIERMRRRFGNCTPTCRCRDRTTIRRSDYLQLRTSRESPSVVDELMRFAGRKSRRRPRRRALLRPGGARCRCPR